METPRRKSKKSKKKASRQPSPAQLKLNSTQSILTQPEAGPSRISAPKPVITDPKPREDEETFGADFISLNIDEIDDQTVSKSTRNWDRGRPELERRSDQLAGRKRGRDELERDGDPRGLSNSHKNPKLLRQAPWTAYVDWYSCKNTAQLMHKEVESFLFYISPTPIEHEVRNMIVQLISSAIKKVYRDAEVLPFGSFGTKLYLPQGDIDLVVLSNTLAYNDKVGSLRSLANIVKRTGLTDKVTVITRAKVPIIKFVTLYGRFPVDISMNQANGVKTGEMINHFLNEFPALRALVLIVKAFLNQRSMNEVYSGGLGSYAIVCLAVSYLQMHPKIRRAEIDSARNLGILTLEFFELYGKYFNYVNTGISVRHGGTYFNKEERGWKDFNKPHLLSIEDPGDINNDISRGSYAIKSVRQTFAGAYDIMVSEIYKRANLIQNGYRSGYSYNIEEMSVLRTILGVSQEVINHRKLVQEVYNKGDLARMVGYDPLAGLMDVGHPKEVLDHRLKEAREVVEDAWGEADMDIGTSDEEEGQVNQVQFTFSEGGRPSSKDKGKAAPKRKRNRVIGYESESRYDIGARSDTQQRQIGYHGRIEGPASKKHRPSSVQDSRPVPVVTLYTSDDEDDRGSESSEGSEKVKAVSRKDIDKGSEDVPFAMDIKRASNSSLEVLSSDGELDEIERAYIKAADALTGSSDDGDDSAYTKGTKTLNDRKGKEKTQSQKTISGDERRAFWAAKTMINLDSDSD